MKEKFILILLLFVCLFGLQIKPATFERDSSESKKITNFSEFNPLTISSSQIESYEVKFTRQKKVNSFLPIICCLGFLRIFSFCLFNFYFSSDKKSKDLSYWGE